MRTPKLLLLFVAGLCATAIATASQPVSAFCDKAEYRIAMRDSVRLYTAVYTPRHAAGESPIIIFRTPYGNPPYGPDAFPAWERGYMRSYLDRGYIVVLQDVRGRYMSEGEFEHVRPAGVGEVDETTDSYDTVDYLVKHIPGNNGRVGFAGSSYPGFYALMGGLCGHPAVKAISPQAPVTDWFMGDDVHHNGVLMLTDAVRFLGYMNVPTGHTPTTEMPRGGITAEPDEYAFFRQYPTLHSLTQLLVPNAFWEEIAAHSDYDAWWRARDTRRACSDIRPAVLVVGGTFDAEDCFGAWNLYRAIRRQSRQTVCHLVVGPWAHGAWRGAGRQLGAFDFGEEASGDYYVQHFEAPFFDHYLKGPATERDTLPEVSAFSSGDNRWRTFAEWTPREARKQTLYLTGGGDLSEQRPVAKSAVTSYVSDPADPVPYVAQSGTSRPREYMLADQRFSEGRQDVLSFVTQPLSGEWTLAGPVEVSLEVALSTADADFVVKLIDVFPDDGPMPGYRMLVRGEVMRGSYRDGFSRRVPFTPGVPERVRFRAPDVVHTFRAGHRLMIQVQSSWFPLMERNPQQLVDPWTCAASDFVPCRVTLYHQRGRASSVTIYRVDQK